MAEPTVQVQVPVSLIERAPHDRGCASFSWNGVGWDNDPAACNCWKVEALSPPTPTAEADHAPTAPLSIADMVPGTTFTARYRLMGAVEDRFTVMPGPPNLWLRGDQYEVGVISDIDPSTIRDVTPPSTESTK